MADTRTDVAVDVSYLGFCLAKKNEVVVVGNQHAKDDGESRGDVCTAQHCTAHKPSFFFLSFLSRERTQEEEDDV